MIGCLRKTSKRVISAKFSSCKQTLVGGINLACMVGCKQLLKQINENMNGQMKER